MNRKDCFDGVFVYGGEPIYSFHFSDLKLLNQHKITPILLLQLRYYLNEPNELGPNRHFPNAP